MSSSEFARDNQINQFELEVTGESSAIVPVGGKAEFSTKLKSAADAQMKFKVEHRLESSVEGSPEWQVRVYLDGALKMDSYSGRSPEFESDISKGDHWITTEVGVAPGASYGDATEIKLNVAADGFAKEQVFRVAVRPSILAVKAAIGHEREVADSIASRAKDGSLGIFSILVPSNIRGYVLLEAMNSDKIENVVRSIRKTHGLVKGETSMDEISHFLTPKPAVSGIVEGDIVELVAGPFKGEKARVQRIDNAREEITVELFEAVVPIPVTVRGDHVRIVSKKKE